MSNPERKSKIPEAPTPAAPASGNLLSSVAPPSQLPNFVTATTPSPVPVVPVPKSQLPPVNPQHVPPALQPVAQLPQPSQVPIVAPVAQSPDTTPQSPEKFSPAIPLAKGEPVVSVRSPEDSQTMSPDSLPESTSEMEKIGDIMPGSGLFTWVKGAVSSGGLLHRVAEKAKSSVDSMITTLDPQMKEYLNSGGDIHIVVASEKEVKISPVREAFQMVFGKATVVGHAASSTETAAQPVGYGAALGACAARAAALREQLALTNDVPIVAVESFLHEAHDDRWYELNLLALWHPSLGIQVQQVSGGTAAPGAALAALRAATPPDYPLRDTGFAVTLGSIMAASLQVPHWEWQAAVCGVSRRELLLLAARALAGQYRAQLALCAAQP